MSLKSQNPLIVQSDKTLLLEVESPFYESARDEISKFAELEKSLEYIHTFRISPISLWNAAASGMKGEDVMDVLRRYTRYPIPGNIEFEVNDYISRFGKLKLKRKEEKIFLESQDIALISEIWRNKKVKKHLTKRMEKTVLEVKPESRGEIKHVLIQIGHPVEDLAGYAEGEHYPITLLEKTKGGMPFSLRKYQREAVSVFYSNAGPTGGSGTVVLPCGAGKTMVGLGIMSLLSQNTLILCPNVIGVKQWIEEIRDKTTVKTEDVGEYTGEKKEIKPITITTYQVLTWRPKKDSEFPHFTLFQKRNWGLIVYDEVHLLPAPVFKVTANLQAKRRLGLTATLIREDGKEKDVFSLIGPKKYDISWKVLESQGWIATAECLEIRVDMTPDVKMNYSLVNERKRYRIAAENPIKYDIIKDIVNRHADDNILVIGMYLDQLRKVADIFKAHIITGKTPRRERERLYDSFKRGEIKLLILSKVANFALDLPDANVAIQISGTFGSRQEEAQRLGRILRPKKDGSIARFYSIVTRGTKDQDYAEKRQLFLTEQGYKYTIIDGTEFARRENSETK
ncbi:MAG: DEAD/DEAH box helicase [Thermoplasmata archaeon]|nr:MAG: DEAD/DEAH box helicase [Thermoplasmata archaeon]